METIRCYIYMYLTATIEYNSVIVAALDKIT